MLVATQLSPLGSGTPGGTGPTVDGVPSSQSVRLELSAGFLPLVQPAGSEPARVSSKSSSNTVIGGGIWARTKSAGLPLSAICTVPSPLTSVVSTLLLGPPMVPTGTAPGARLSTRAPGSKSRIGEERNS